MPNFKVCRKSDGEEVARYSAAQAVERVNDIEYPFSDFDHVEFEPDDSAVTPVANITTTKITKLAFRNRFSLAEKAALDIASIDNVNAPMEQRQFAAMLRVFQADVLAATYIDLARQDVRTGVQMLEQYGLLGAGRASEILDTPPTEEEVYRGE